MRQCIDIELWKSLYLINKKVHEFNVIAYTVEVLHQLFVEIFCLNNRFNIDKWKVILRTQLRFYLPNFKKKTNVKGFDNILKVLVIMMNCFTDIKENIFEKWDFGEYYTVSRQKW